MADRYCFVCLKCLFVSLNLALSAVGLYLFMTGVQQNVASLDEHMHSVVAMIGIVTSLVGGFGFMAACFESHNMLFWYCSGLIVAFGLEVYAFLKMNNQVREGLNMPDEKVMKYFLANVASIELALILISLRMGLVIRKERMYYDRY